MLESWLSNARRTNLQPPSKSFAWMSSRCPARAQHVLQFSWKTLLPFSHWVFDPSFDIWYILLREYLNSVYRALIGGFVFPILSGNWKLDLEIVQNVWRFTFTHFRLSLFGFFIFWHFEWITLFDFEVRIKFLLKFLWDLLARFRKLCLGLTCY